MDICTIGAIVQKCGLRMIKNVWRDLMSDEKKLYEVKFPVVGTLVVEVRAYSKEEAMEKVYGTMDLEVSSLYEDDDIEDACVDNVEMLHKLNSGNVCYAPRPWKVEAEEMDEE